VPGTRDRRRILLYCNRFSKVVRIRAAPGDQKRDAGQRYQSMLEWWSREKLPPSFRPNDAVARVGAGMVILASEPPRSREAMALVGCRTI
jgi:hypothetical protein